MIQKFVNIIVRDKPSIIQAFQTKRPIAEWEAIVGQSADEQGCECCGQPHQFSGWEI